MSTWTSHRVPLQTDSPVLSSHWSQWTQSRGDVAAGCWTHQRERRREDDRQRKREEEEWKTKQSYEEPTCFLTETQQLCVCCCGRAQQPAAAQTTVWAPPTASDSTWEPAATNGFTAHREITAGAFDSVWTKTCFTASVQSKFDFWIHYSLVWDNLDCLCSGLSVFTSWMTCPHSELWQPVFEFRRYRGHDLCE